MSEAGRLAGAVVGCLLTLAAIAGAQGTDCLISPNGATITCPQQPLPALQGFAVGVPAITNPISNFTAAWTLLNNTAGASIIGLPSCGPLPGGATCPVTVQVTQIGTVTVRADLVITTPTGLMVNKNCEVTLTVVDGGPPVITCPPDVNVQCGAPTTPPATGTATATDCTPTTITFSDAITGTNCAGQIITRTWTATDAGGATATCVQIITTVDTTPPTVTCPGPASVQCFSQVPQPNPSSVTASDNCGGVVVVTWQGDAASNGTSNCNNVITRTYLGTDPCGNTATCTQLITVNDTTPPTVTCPGPASVQCFSQVPPPAPTSVTSSDNCGGPVIVTWQGDSASNGQSSCNNVITRTYLGTDSCGNTGTCTQLITVNDTTPPTVTCPGATTVECFSQVPQPNPGSVTASDNCGGLVVVTWQGDSATNGTANCNVITRTYLGTDPCGNTGTCTQTITVNDNVPPVITCPPDVLNLPCGSPTTPASTGTATATDNCDPNPAITWSDGQTGTCSIIPGPNPTTMTITRTWTATDSCNNSASCIQIITLVGPPDPCTQPLVANLGGGCGLNPPQLAMSLPMPGGFVSLHVGNAAPNAQLVIAAQLPPFGPTPPITPPCVIGVDVYSPSTMLMDQLATDSAGEWSYAFLITAIPELAGVNVRVQAATYSVGGPLGFIEMSDTIEGTIGNCPPCTATREEWGGFGPVGAIYDANWLTLFPGGMTIGVYNPGNGAAAPNGVFWSGDITGRDALHQFLANLPAPGSTNAILFQDALNATSSPQVTVGSGSLARFTAVLQLNIAFSAAGLLGGNPVPQPGIGALIYLNPGDSLNGFTVLQILNVANQVLAGVAPLPAGYTLTTLAGLLEDLSLAFDDCVPSMWASTHLFVNTTP